MIEIGTRIYATEEIDYSWTDDGSPVLPAGAEGVVIEVRSPARWADMLVEWDLGFIGAVDSGSIAAVTS